MKPMRYGAKGTKPNPVIRIHPADDVVIACLEEIAARYVVAALAGEPIPNRVV